MYLQMKRSIIYFVGLLCTIAILLSACKSSKINEVVNDYNSEKPPLVESFDIKNLKKSTRYQNKGQIVFETINGSQLKEAAQQFPITLAYILKKSCTECLEKIPAFVEYDRQNNLVKILFIEAGNELNTLSKILYETKYQGVPYVLDTTTYGSKTTDKVIKLNQEIGKKDSFEPGFPQNYVLGYYGEILKYQSGSLRSEILDSLYVVQNTRKYGDSTAVETLNSFCLYKISNTNRSYPYEFEGCPTLFKVGEIIDPSKAARSFDYKDLDIRIHSYFGGHWNNTTLLTNHKNEVIYPYLIDYISHIKGDTIMLQSRNHYTLGTYQGYLIRDNVVNWSKDNPQQRYRKDMKVFNSEMTKVLHSFDTSNGECVCQYPRIIDYTKYSTNRDGLFEAYPKVLKFKDDTGSKPHHAEKIQYLCKVCKSEYLYVWNERGPRYLKMVNNKSKVLGAAPIANPPKYADPRYELLQGKVLPKNAISSPKIIVKYLLERK